MKEVVGANARPMSKVDVLSCHLNLVLGFENAASLLETVTA
jgi:hypothetical protein